jgi:hypothetical protein
VDPCVETPTAPSCLDEGTALFVSASASSQGAAGTREKPFATVNAALSATTSEKRRIYVCEGTYAEDLALDAKHSGVSVFGGVTCAWEPSGTKPVLGASATPLHIESATGVAFVDVAVEAKDAAEGSSIAAFVHGGSVTFKGVRLVAGKGAKGADGELTPFTFPSQAELKGNDAVDENVGGPEKSVMCPGGGVTKGGKGGNLGNPGEQGSPGPSNAGVLSNCTSDVNGATAQAASAAAGADALGSLTDNGWIPSSGEDGAHGAPGQGGGGGYGNQGAGGGGGAGGCGGAGGQGGDGGGGSIAIAVHEANVSLAGSELRASGAGAGGKGAEGQAGQTQVGAGGTRSGLACNGGNGGQGGGGGAGGGGAGGVSVGVVYSGTKPTLDSATERAIAVGKVGSGGPGGAGGAAENAGVDGEAKPILEAP